MHSQQDILGMHIHTLQPNMHVVMHVYMQVVMYLITREGCNVLVTNNLLVMHDLPC